MNASTLRIGRDAIGQLLVALLAPVLVWAVQEGPGESRAVIVSLSGNESRSELSERLAQLGLVSSQRLLLIYLVILSPGVRPSPGFQALMAAARERYERFTDEGVQATRLG